MIVFGRVIRDFIPVHPEKYLPHPVWRETLQKREEALRVRHARSCERLSQYTVKLSPLKVGDHVHVQNQRGNRPRKWEKSGVVVEDLQNDQYRVRIDGSRQATLRNRKFLRQFTPLGQIPGPPTVEGEQFPPVHNRITQSTPHTSTEQDKEVEVTRARTNILPEPDRADVRHIAPTFKPKDLIPVRRSNRPNIGQHPDWLGVA